MLAIKCLLAVIACCLLILAQSSEPAYESTPFKSSIKQFSLSAKDALLDPVTLGAAVFAAGIYFSNTDKQITRWATKNNPVYGSESSARRASNILQYSSLAISCLAWISKNRQFSSTPLSFPLTEMSSDFAAIASTIMTTELMKNSFDRKRPDGSDTRSFPSGHTSFTTINATLASNDIEDMNTSRAARFALNFGLCSIVAATAWGRVEARKHYASDVLAGAALGHFVADFIDNLYANTDFRKNSSLNMYITPKDYQVNVALQF